MSNLSAIGFGVTTQEQLEALLQKVYPKTDDFACAEGTYYRFTDDSGAELWLQTNTHNEFIGFNPHFNGESRRRVRITEFYTGEESILDGAYYAWANPTEGNEGDYPFVFDLPDFKLAPIHELPQDVLIQLTAFGRQTVCYADEAAFYASQEEKMPYAAESFVPIGLFSRLNGPDDTPAAPPATALMAGRVLRCEQKENAQTGETFLWVLINTLGGEVDLVLDPAQVVGTPVENGIIFGEFWLSGRITGGKEEFRLI